MKGKSQTKPAAKPVAQASGTAQVRDSIEDANIASDAKGSTKKKKLKGTATVQGDETQPNAQHVQAKPAKTPAELDRPERSASKKKKKKNKNKTAQPSSGTMVDETVPATSGKSRGNEIDDIFDDAVEKIAKQVKETKASQSAEKRAAPASADDEFFDSRGLLNKKRKKVDGVYVYYLDELGVGSGGGTPDCPFDCKCCY